MRGRCRYGTWDVPPVQLGGSVNVDGGSGIRAIRDSRRLAQSTYRHRHCGNQLHLHRLRRIRLRREPEELAVACAREGRSGAVHRLVRLGVISVCSVPIERRNALSYSRLIANRARYLVRDVVVIGSSLSSRTSRAIPDARTGLMMHGTFCQLPAFRNTQSPTPRVDQRTCRTCRADTPAHRLRTTSVTCRRDRRRRTSSPGPALLCGRGTPAAGSTAPRSTATTGAICQGVHTKFPTYRLVSGNVDQVGQRSGTAAYPGLFVIAIFCGYNCHT